MNGGRTLTRALVLAAIAGLATAPGRVAAQQNVLVAGADFTTAWITDVQSKIAATGLISGGVDAMSLLTTTPTAADLRQYAAVLVFTDSPPANNATFGDALAEYVDCGGGVVVCHFAFDASYGVAGRWSTDGYSPLVLGGTDSGTPLTLGAIFVPAHPVMAGVASLAGGSSSYHGTGGLSPTAIAIANWSNGQPLIAEMPGFNARIIGLNFFAPSNGARADFWDATTDGAKLMANALLYVSDVTPPTGMVSAPTVATGAPATVTATASCVGTADLYYRKIGGSATFTVLAMAESAPGVGDWSAQIPGTDVGPDGVQYYVRLSDGRNVATLPSGAPTTCSAVQVNRTTTVAVPGRGSFLMAGVPFAPVNSAPEAVFDELGAYNPRAWRYGTFDPAAGAYLQPPAAVGVVPGQGFWVMAKNATSAAVGGRSTNLTTNFQIVLRPGFNQIANPFSFAVTSASLVLPTGVERNLISWTSTGYLAGNATLSPGLGYWIKNNGPGNQTIEIPAFPTPGPAPALPAPGALPAEEPGWSVQAIASAGAFDDRGNRFGVRPGATRSKDAYDFSDPPPPPAGFVTLALIGDDETPLMSDYRPEGTDGASWRLQVASDQAGQPFRITFDRERELPQGWVLVAYGPGGLRETDLSADGVLSGTVGSAPFQREWTIAAGTPEWTESVRSELSRSASSFSFSAPIPNPSRGPSFDLALPEAAHVDARVFDVTGRAVRTLVDAQLERGYHLLEWNGADASGRRAASGVYFVRLRTGQHDESRKVVLLN